MNRLHIKATEDSPEIDFNFGTHILSINGEAYPENAAHFFQPILLELRNYLNATSDCDILVNFHLTYFNSASTKMLYNLFELLDESANTRSNHIVIHWHHDEEDDASLEFCHDIKDDFRWIVFKTVSIDTAS